MREHMRIIHVDFHIPEEGNSKLEISVTNAENSWGKRRKLGITWGWTWRWHSPDEQQNEIRKQQCQWWTTKSCEVDVVLT